MHMPQQVFMPSGDGAAMQAQQQQRSPRAAPQPSPYNVHDVALRVAALVAVAFTLAGLSISSDRNWTESATSYLVSLPNSGSSTPTTQVASGATVSGSASLYSGNVNTCSNAVYKDPTARAATASGCNGPYGTWSQMWFNNACNVYAVSDLTTTCKVIALVGGASTAVLAFISIALLTLALTAFSIIRLAKGTRAVAAAEKAAAEASSPQAAAPGAAPVVQKSKLSLPADVAADVSVSQVNNAFNGILIAALFTGIAVILHPAAIASALDMIMSDITKGAVGITTSSSPRPGSGWALVFVATILLFVAAWQTFTLSRELRRLRGGAGLCGRCSRLFGGGARPQTLVTTNPYQQQVQMQMQGQGQPQVFMPSGTGGYGF